MKNNLAILLIFFARPNTLSEVFEAVRKAKPSKLFLACDGPREGNSNDAKMIEECKKIVQNVDWDCEVHTKYSEENLGCGQGPSSAISWAFEFVDKLVILEDDCVPDESFFPYMEEMLDKYEHDERIGIISGFNHFKDWDCAENSYFFTKCGATLGWGTWKRVWDKYDYHIEGINDEYLSELLKEEIIDKKGARVRIKDWKKANKETKEKKVNYWDIQFGFLKYTQSYLCIVPRSNLIYNIGCGPGSTHTESMQSSKWKPGQILFMPTIKMEFPLKHPKYVICDRNYDKKAMKMLFHRSLLKRAIKKLIRMIKR